MFPSARQLIRELSFYKAWPIETIDTVSLDVDGTKSIFL